MNEKQQQVIDHDRGPLAVVAVAGSGKTTALVHRIARLVRSGVPKDRILAVTYTVKAADEMSKRLKALGTPVTVGTLHATAWRMAQEGPAKGMGLLEERDFYDMLRLAIRSARVTVELRAAEGYIAKSKATLQAPSPAAKDVLSRVYREFERLRLEKGKVTYDDMIVMAVRWLEADEAVRRTRASKWDYVMQDEAQDENLAQRRLLRLLCQDHRNLMIVGDPSQSIYGFRGSDPRAFEIMAQDYPDLTRIVMDQNYRSGPDILTAANKILAEIGAPARLACGKPDHVGVVHFLSPPNPKEEAREIVAMIKSLLQTYSPAHIAVLYRFNAQSAWFEVELAQQEIPYQVRPSGSFYKRREVAGMLGFLRIIAGTASVNDVWNACFNPPLKVSRLVINSIVEPFLLSGARVTDIETRVVNRLRHEMHNVPSYVSTKLMDWAGRVSRVRAAADFQDAVGIIDLVEKQFNYTETMLSEVTSDVDGAMQQLREWATNTTLPAFLDDMREREVGARRAERSYNAVTLSSIHSAKGLEWPIVFMAGVNDGTLPAEAAEDPDEEWRLAYVAATRAKDALIVSSCEGGGSVFDLLQGSG